MLLIREDMRTINFTDALAIMDRSQGFGELVNGLEESEGFDGIDELEQDNMKEMTKERKLKEELEDTLQREQDNNIPVQSILFRILLNLIFLLQIITSTAPPRHHRSAAVSRPCSWNFL